MTHARGEVLDVARKLASRPEGFGNGELAAEAAITSEAAGVFILKYLAAGHIFKGKPEGKHARYFDTRESADAFAAGSQKDLARTDDDPAQIARAAVKLLQAKGILSSSALGELLKRAPAVIDTAIAPLASTGKLLRVAVLRKGVSEFDYRIGAAWAPKESDFSACAGHASAPVPVPSVSPLTPAAPHSPAPAKLLQPAALPRTAEDRTETGRRGAQGRAAANALKASTPAASTFLGWADARPPKALEATTRRSLDTDRPEAAYRDDSAPASGSNIELPMNSDSSIRTTARGAGQIELLEIDDLVCAINSRGELALDLGDGGPVKCIRFSPERAYLLKKFLDNTSVLEQLKEENAI
jgi:hypothetical protein